MRVLVTFAVDAEFAPWRKLRSYRSIQYQGLQLWRCDVEGVELTVLITGMGLHAAELAMDLMMKRADRGEYFDVCISSGLAGALHASLMPGNIIAPKGLVTDRGYADLEKGRLEVDVELRAHAVARGAKALDCNFSAGRVLAKATDKRECALRAESVDMESFEIVREANAWGARSVVIRAISDVASEDLPIDFNLTMSRTNQASVGKILLQLAKRPWVLSALIRFGRQSKQAATALAAFLDEYVKGIAEVANARVTETVAAR